MVRIKERYLLVNIIYPPNLADNTKGNVPDLVVLHQPTVEKLSPWALLKGIRTEAALLYGDYGAGALEGHLSVKYLSLATSTFILRCSRAHYQLLWSTLTFMNQIPVKGGRPCIFRVVRVSGTIRKAEEEAIRQAKMLILAAKENSGLQESILTTRQQTRDDEIMLDVDHDSSDDDDAMEEDDG